VASDENPLLRERLASGLAALRVDAASSGIEQCLRYLGLLQKWNRVYNLTAIDDPLEMVSRHILDSLSVGPYLTGQRILDVGTGAGLPGVPLAIFYPAREFHLLDSNGKKMRFLFQVKLDLGLHNVRLHECRAEEFTASPGFDCILSRAFASLADMIRVTGHLLGPGGCFLAMKSATRNDELAGVPSAYNVAARIALSVPGVEAPRELLRIERA